MNNKTVRLIYPQWQGGENPDYVFGSELLACIAPPSDTAETIRIAVDQDFMKESKELDGIAMGEDLLAQMNETKKILAEKDADKVIVFGGDCSVTQAPFDYLGGKYGDKIGIIWIDSHPDISNTKESKHLNECVLGDLLGRSQDGAVTHVDNPYSPEKVIFAGLIEEDLRDMDKGAKELGIQIISPEELTKSRQAIFDWIDRNGLKYVAIHWDVDVTSPDSFRSTYPGEPWCDFDKFREVAAIGRMKLMDLADVFADIETKAEIVGLNVTEHMPWDAMNLRGVMSGIDIFK